MLHPIECMNSKVTGNLHANLSKISFDSHLCIAVYICYHDICSSLDALYRRHLAGINDLCRYKYQYNMQ